jgi:protein-disulfide isomerase-like protein with CxxC motif
MAKTFLGQANVEYHEVLATDNVELVKSLNITSAPTLVVVENGNTEVVENVSNIRRFIETNLVK